MAYTAVQDNDGLSLSVLKKRVPSIFAPAPHVSRSERYSYVSTEKVLHLLMEEDFVPVWAGQTKTRDVADRGFAKHMIRFRHKSDTDRSANGRAELGYVLPEIVFMNAHNGTSSARPMSGIIRFICENGLIVADKMMSATIRHTGDALDEVVKNAHVVLRNSVQSIEYAKEWSKIQLKESQRQDIAKKAHDMRFSEDSMIDFEELLKVRRAEDSGRDLWTTFNVVQENIIKGGLTGGGVIDGRWKMSRTSEVQAVSRQVELNQSLWEMCLEYA